MLEFLPQRVKSALEHVNQNLVYEIRIRANKPVTVNFNGKFVFLTDFGVSENKNNAVVCDIVDVQDCVYRAGNYSVYSVEEQLKEGFITAKHGERIGIAGEYVFEKGQPHAIRAYSSLCIRVPHEIVGCGQAIYDCCMSDRVRSVLLCASPGQGKTTILRDLCRVLGEKTRKNLLICDERGEVSVGDVGDFTDVIRFSDKKTAFSSGIRAMRPQIIVTDELSLEDCKTLEKAVVAGITVVASAHFSKFSYIKSPFLEIFERFVLLDTEKTGQIVGIYNRKGERLY